jgi:hypothetical protein
MSSSTSLLIKLKITFILVFHLKTYQKLIYIKSFQFYYVHCVHFIWRREHNNNIIIIIILSFRKERKTLYVYHYPHFINSFISSSICYSWFFFSSCLVQWRQNNKKRETKQKKGISDIIIIEMTLQKIYNWNWKSNKKKFKATWW